MRNIAIAWMLCVVTNVLGVPGYLFMAFTGVGLAVSLAGEKIQLMRKERQ